MARNDGDTWDLASSVGTTATMVAAQRVLAHREGLIDDPLAEPLVRAVGVDFVNRVLDGEIEFDTTDPAFQSLPPFDLRRAAEHMAVRTRHFDTLFADAAAAGVRQAVILAAGLDTRAYRLPWVAGTTVFELDQPEVIDFKTATLADMGAVPTATLCTIGIDLRDDWPKELGNNGFDASQSTAWIAEGLLIYLPPDAQDLLFDRIDDLSASGSRLATERVPAASLVPNERSRLMSQRLKQFGHDIEFSDLVYQGERASVTDYLAARGWDASTHDVRDAYAANGFHFPDERGYGLFDGLTYISAVKR